MDNPLDRRSFLKLAGASGLVAAVSPSQVVAAEPSSSTGKRRRIRKGIMFGTVDVKGSVLEKFRAVKEAGFEGLEPNSHMDQEEVLRARDATGLVLPSVCCSTH